MSSRYFFWSIFFTIVHLKDTNVIRTHCNRSNKIYEDLLNNQDTILVITNTSVKNNIAISVSHIQKGYNIVNTCVYHTINVNFTKAELFAIRCRIDQAVVATTSCKDQ